MFNSNSIELLSDIYDLRSLGLNNEEIDGYILFFYEEYGLTVKSENIYEIN